VAGFVVSYGIESGVYTQSIDAGAATEQQIDGLLADVTYYFVVRAYDTEGVMSDPSKEISGRVPVVNIICPAPIGTSSDGAPTRLTFSPRVGGGTAPIRRSCAPHSGSLFSVGMTPLVCEATDAIGQHASCSSWAMVMAFP